MFIPMHDENFEGRRQFRSGTFIFFILVGSEGERG